MAIKSALESVQNKLHIPQITKEHVYAAEWAVTTVAFTALSFYAPFTFFMMSIPLAFAHVMTFSQAVKELDPSNHNTVKMWMITACVVASAFLTVMALRSLPFLPAGVQALSKLKMSKALFYFTWSTGLIGFGGGAAKALYNRGLEISKQDTWESMRAHMMNTDAKNRIKSFFDKFGFALGLFDPVALNFMVTNAAQAALFKFIPEERKEQRFRELLGNYVAVALHARREAEQIWPEIWANFKSFPVEKQIQLLPQMIQIKGNGILNDLPTETHQAYTTNLGRVQNKHALYFGVCQHIADGLYGRIDAIRDAKTEGAQLDAISQEFQQLRNDITKHLDDIKLYRPDIAAGLAALTETQSELLKTQGNVIGLTVEQFDYYRFGQLLRELQIGEKCMKLQQLNSQKISHESAGENIDLEDMTWNYFLVKYSDTEHRQLRTGEGFVDELRTRVGVADVATLDVKLNEMGIGTIGEFIEKVLGSDRTPLNDPTEVLRQFDAFLASKNDARGKIYTSLAGQAAAHSSYAVNLAGKAAYKTAMIITAVAPIIVYPKLVATAAIVSTLYYTVPFITKRIDYLRQNEVVQIIEARYGFVYSLATRRPFISLLTTHSTGEMSTYTSSDTLGKMRILAAEFFWGLGLLNASFDQRGQLEGLGGVVQGLAIGREAAEQGSRAWRRLKSMPNPLRRQAETV